MAQNKPKNERGPSCARTTHTIEYPLTPSEFADLSRYAASKKLSVNEAARQLVVDALRTFALAASRDLPDRFHRKLFDAFLREAVKLTNREVSIQNARSGGGEVRP